MKKRLNEENYAEADNMFSDRDESDDGADKKKKKRKKPKWDDDIDINGIVRLFIWINRSQ